MRTTSPLLLLTVLLAACAMPIAEATESGEVLGGETTTTTSTLPPTTTTTTTTLPPTTTTTTLPPSTTTSTTVPDGHKWFVCKYVGTPGLDERLQTGDNPISVDGHSIATYPSIVLGAFFADQQGRSVVIAQDIGQAEPDPDEACPRGDTGTTTTTSTTTSTTSTTTTTTLPPTGPTASVTDDCAGIHLDFEGFTGTGSNQVEIEIGDEIPISILFPPLNTTTFPVPQDGEVHDWTVTLDAAVIGQAGPNDQVFTGTVGPCGGGITPLLEIQPTAECTDDNLPAITIFFGNRPDLDGQTGTLTAFLVPEGTFLDSIELEFISGGSSVIPYPATTQDLILTYSLGEEEEDAAVAYPAPCPVTETTTTTTLPGSTTTTLPGTTTTLPGTFQFSGASTVCVSEVPTIRIIFGNAVPELAGQTGTLTMTAVNGGAVVGTQSLTYIPGATVDILYPGTRVNADGSIADVPGWTLQSNGFWVLDPSDEYLRDGIVLTYVLNPTATATVQYPPESSACADPNGPFPPGATPPTSGQLPSTGGEIGDIVLLAGLTMVLGTGAVLGARRRRAV